MKNYLNFLATIVILGILISFTACDDGGDDGPQLTPVEEATQLLTGESVEGAAASWSVQSVDVDGIDFTEVYETITIDFDNGTYTATNSTAVFAETGNWSFIDENATSLSLDNLDVTLIELTANRLEFELVIEETRFGRTAAVGGVNTFVMTR